MGTLDFGLDDILISEMKNGEGKRAQSLYLSVYLYFLRPCLSHIKLESLCHLLFKNISHHRSNWFSLYFSLSLYLSFMFVFVFVFSEILPAAYHIQNPFVISFSKIYHIIGVSGFPFICLCLCICLYICICIFVRIGIADIMAFQKIYGLRGP